jgi:hypothetical protein
LKFNHPFEKGGQRQTGDDAMQRRGSRVMQFNDIVQQTGLLQRDWPMLGRFFTRLVLDILPAALASVIGGFLFTQYHSGHAAALRPAAEQAAPASAEMMQLVRDEHAMIVDYLKVQMAAQKSRIAAEDADSARAEADAKAAAAAATRRLAAAAVAAKSVPARSKAPAVAAVVIPTHTPLVIVRAEATNSAAPAENPARDQDSLLAKTLNIKDHVVDATLHAVSAIGSIPSWIASMGDRIGGASTGSGPARQQFSDAS